MSNRPHHRHRRPRTPRPDPAAVQAAARLSALANGCTCQPDVTLTHRPDGRHVHIAHDLDCPAVDAPSGLAVVPTTARHPEENP